jgi:hypothetical protein
MFKIAVDPTYVAPVKGELAGGTPFEFEAVFRRLTNSELGALNDKVRAGMSDAEVVGRVLAGWNHVQNDDGEPLAFTPENLFRLLNVAGVQAAVIEAFYTSLPGARRKN